MVKLQYSTLPQVEKKITKVMGELGIQPVRPSETILRSISLKKRFYMLPVRYRGEVAWFKASLEAAPGLTKSLHHEIQIQKAFGDFERQFHPRFDSPSYIDAGGQGSFRWLLRKYWKGGFAGDMSTVFGYRPSVLSRISPQRFAGVLEDVANMSNFMRKRLRVYHHDVSWYLLDFRYYQRNFFISALRKKKLNPGWNPADIRRFSRHFVHAKQILKTSTRYFSHGDLYPNNVMLVGAKPSMVLFDWELANWNLQPFDSMMVYLLAWQRPDWQKKFRSASARWMGSTATIEWYLAQLSLATRFAGFAYARLTNTQPERYGPLPTKSRKKILAMYQHMVDQINQADSFLRQHS